MAIPLSTLAENVAGQATTIHQAASQLGRHYLRQPNAFTVDVAADLFDAAQRLRAAADYLDAIRRAHESTKV